MRRIQLLGLSIIPLSVFAWLSLGVGTTSCNQGTCGVASGSDGGPGVQLLQCGVLCVDPSGDVNNCGDCGEVCGDGQICSNSTC